MFKSIRIEIDKGKPKGFFERIRGKKTAATDSGIESLHISQNLFSSGSTHNESATEELHFKNGFLAGSKKVTREFENVKRENERLKMQLQILEINQELIDNDPVVFENDRW